MIQGWLSVEIWEPKTLTILFNSLSLLRGLLFFFHGEEINTSSLKFCSDISRHGRVVAPWYAAVFSSLDPGSDPGSEKFFRNRKFLKVIKYLKQY